jgi:hypothetical protein
MVELKDGPERGHDVENSRSVKAKSRPAFHLLGLNFLLDSDANLSVHFSEADCKRTICISGLSHSGCRRRISLDWVPPTCHAIFRSEQGAMDGNHWCEECGALGP